jgi:hypothetical protein
VVYLYQPGADVAADMAALRRAGAGWVRVLPDWSRLEPRQGKLDWKTLDTLVQEARRQGLSLVITLGYTPRWASRYRDVEETDVWNKNAPADLAAWRHLVAVMAGRYQGQVGTWQVWERPSVHHFRGSYKDLRELSAETIRASLAGGRRRVLMPEPGRINLRFIDKLYEWGADRYFDALALYPYYDQPEQMLRPLSVLQKEIVARRGPAKEIWIAGLGWSTEAVPGPLRRPLAREDEQAALLVRGMVLALGNGVRRVFWETWRDLGQGPYQAQSRSGLVRADGTPRPAHQAYSHLAGLLEGMQPAGQARWGPHLYGYLFAGPAGAALVAWSDRPPARLVLPAPLPVTDHLGRGLGARAELSLGPAPLFLRGSRAELEGLLGLRPSLAPAPDPDWSGAEQVSAVLEKVPLQKGLDVARYRALEAGTARLAWHEGKAGWSTDLGQGKAAILADVDDTFLYWVDGRYQVQIEVEVYGNTGPRPAGFNIGYDGEKGYSFTPWQWVEAGPGWKRYTFTIQDAAFSDPDSDFRINALGSKADVTVRSLTVRRQRPGAGQRAGPGLQRSSKSPARTPASTWNVRFRPASIRDTGAGLRESSP